MTYRDILVVPARSRDAAMPYAVSFAAAFDAKLTAATFVGEPDWPPAVLSEAPYGVLVEARADLRREAEERMRLAGELARKAGVSCATETIVVQNEPVEDALGRYARVFDLTILPQQDPEFGNGEAALLERALFESGRSVLVVPYIHTQAARMERVIVAWDKSAVAARAIGDALPILKRAERVEVVKLMPLSDKGVSAQPNLDGAEMAAHLARHGVKTEFVPIRCDAPFADMLMSHAFDWGADLIVMGGYGHSALRESLFGGMTRGVLEAMTVPTLIAH